MENTETNNGRRQWRGIRKGEKKRKMREKKEIKLRAAQEE
jgi:hypothetical protein